MDIKLNKRTVIFGTLLVFFAVVISNVTIAFLPMQSFGMFMISESFAAFLIIGALISFFGKIRSIYEGLTNSLISAFLGSIFVILMSIVRASMVYIGSINAPVVESATWNVWDNIFSLNLLIFVIWIVPIGGIIGSYIYNKLKAPEPSLNKTK